MKANEAFSVTEFSKIATRDEGDFADFGTVVTQGRGAGNTYTFKDNGSDILGVAHLDTVQGGAWSSIIQVKKTRVLLCPRLDDRLGVYIITRLLPAMGITCDWLLTTGEEVGRSSAELFAAEKKYKWAFSFDRAGTDVVLYQHDHRKMRKVLRKNGFVVGNGSFSDISFLDIGCSGINFGCGYEDAHSKSAYAILPNTFYMVDMFVSFWKRYAMNRLPYKEPAKRYWHTPTYYSGWWNDHKSGSNGNGSNGNKAAFPDWKEDERWASTIRRYNPAYQYHDWYEVEQEGGWCSGMDSKTNDEIIEDLADRAQEENQ